jgi:hypothetical protein
MALEHLTAALAHSRNGGSRLLVLVVVATNADARGEWITDQATLQKQARLGRRRVQQILGELIADGELAVVPGKGRGNRSAYRLLIAAEKSAAERVLSAPPSPPFPPDPLIPLIPQKQSKTEETFGLAPRPLSGPQSAVFQINLIFREAGIPLPPPAQIVLWSKALGGVEPLIEQLTRLIQAGLANKRTPAAYVHRVVTRRAARLKAALAEGPGRTGGVDDTRRRQAARLAGKTPRSGR